MPGMELADILRSPALSVPEVARELAEQLASRDPLLASHHVADSALLAALDETWERGWQPADGVHTVRRDAVAGAVSLATALIAEHSRRTDAASRAPEVWLDQLRDLEALTPGDPAVVRVWHRVGRRSPVEAWRIVLQLLAVLRTTGRIEHLVPPPSRWGSARARPTAEPGADGDRALRRIRGLLAKAESTDFPEEAEALTAKAQELMTRHAVDAALLEAGP